MVGSYAVVRGTLVENVVLWDGQPGWATPAGTVCVKVPDGQPVGPGWTFSGVTWTAPAPEVVNVALLNAEAIVAAQVDPTVPDPTAAALLNALAVISVNGG